jgi:hypothetical protein
LAYWQEGYGMPVTALRDSSNTPHLAAPAPPAGCDLGPAADFGVAATCADASTICPERGVRPLIADFDSHPAWRPVFPDDFALNLSCVERGWRLVAIGRAAMLFEGAGRDNVYTQLIAMPGEPESQPIPPAAAVAYDMDAPGGLRVLCSPLKARRSPADDPPDRQLPAIYRPPYLVSQTAQGRILLQRCGSDRAQVLAKDTTAAPVFTRRVIAWAKGHRLMVRDRRTRRVATYRLNDEIAALVATDRRIWIGGFESAFVLDLG